MLQSEVKTNLKSEVLAVVFGMLIILTTFGDNGVPNPSVGNLDSIFGLSPSFWHSFMDVLYPLASIIIFLLYGKVRGVLRIRVSTILVFLIFLMSLAMIIIDDILGVLGYSPILPDLYEGIAQWVYLSVAIGSFLAFGWISARQRE